MGPTARRGTRSSGAWRISASGWSLAAWSYRVELLDSDAELLWQSEPLQEEAVAWPRGLALTTGTERLLRVRADRGGGGATVDSPLVSFVVP